MAAVQFHAVHQFSSSPLEVMVAMVDGDLYANLQLPDLSLPEVLGRSSEGGRTSLQLRYAFIGHLDPLGRRLVGADHLSWIQQVEVDTSARAGRLTFASVDRSQRLRGEAEVRFHAEHGGTSRQIDGDLTIAMRLGAAAVERRIIAGLLRDLDLEAQAIREQLSGGCLP